MPKRVHRHEVVQPQDQSYRLIPLTQGLNAIVDVADYEWLNQWFWYASRVSRVGTYACRKEGHRQVYMHVIICQPFDGKQIDHVNHDTLDNRRNNLRECTPTENARNSRKGSRNTSGFKGVSWKKSHRKWCAQMRINGKSIHIGHFDTPEDAAKAHDELVSKLHGEFACLNFA